MLDEMSQPELSAAEKFVAQMLKDRVGAYLSDPEQVLVTVK